ncbi:hypothetical protein [Limnobacter sp.]|uniref:hypothetical protein n=1 Tax=Limnobacter sp. TaxID=2003368 RepID=UPI0025C46E7F|nr:hypothetical protein [Limnobacter sp.]
MGLAKRCAKCGKPFVDYSEGFVNEFPGDCKAQSEPKPKPRKTNKKKVTKDE